MPEIVSHAVVCIPTTATSARARGETRGQRPVRSGPRGAPWRLVHFVAAVVLALGPQVARAAKVTVDLGDSGDGVTFVGAFNRWDEDGNARREVNPKQKIDGPEVDATAAKEGNNTWVFKNLSPGKHDLVILAGDRVRIEGWYYTPVLEFDPVFPPTATTDEETAETISDHVKKSPHYENKVVPLYLGGDKKAIRILVMLIRDKVTSYESDFPGAATIRHEIWQYDWQYGGWAKNRRTRVLDRVMIHRDELRKWTWLWDPKLGGIEVKKTPFTIHYEVPKPSEKKLKGLYPY